MRNTRRMAVLGLAAGVLAMGVANAPAGADKGRDKESDEREERDDDDKGRKPAKQIKLQVLSFNDYHGNLQPPGGSPLGLPYGDTTTALGGAEFLSSKLTELRATAKNTVTVAAGDLIGGSTALSGIFHDEPSVESLEAMKLDVSSVGNHEFDEGLTELLRMQNGGCHPVDGCYFPDAPYDGAAFPWLAANVVYSDSGKPVLAPTWVKEVDGVKVGFIGMTLEATPTLVGPAGIAGLTFKDEVESANAAAKRLRRNNVNSIVVLLHEGGFQTGVYNGCTGISGPIVDIATNLDPAIDLVVTGHTHVPYVCTINDPAGQPRQVTSASSFGRVVTETWLTIDKKTRDVVRPLTTSTNHLVTRVNPDPALTAIIAKWKTLGDPILNQVIGTAAEDITGGQTNRIAETAMSNFVADALLAAANAALPGGADVGLINPGGVRAPLIVSQISSGEQPGQITYAEAFNVSPFANVVVAIDFTGAQLKAALEEQFRARGSRPQLVLGVSEGLTYDWVAANPFDSKVENLQINGVPVDPAATYTVATINFLADGGDEFTRMTAGTNRIGITEDITALIDYIAAKSPVTSPGTNRITER